MDYDQVTDLNPNNIFAYYNRGGLKLNTGNLTGALNDFSKVIQLYPGFVPAYINRSEVKRRMNNQIGAMQDQKIAEKISNDSSLRNNLARIDSSYFNSIIELKANFDYGDINSNNAIANNMAVQMKEPYIVSFREQPNRKEFYEGELAFLNRYSDKKNFLAFIPAEKEKISHQTFGEIAAHFHFKSNTYQHLLLQGLIYGYLHDYNKAFEILKKADQQKPDEYIYYFILAGLKFQLTELMGSIEIKNNYLTIGDWKNTRVKPEINLRTYYQEILGLYNRCILLKPDFALVWFNRAYTKSLLNDQVGAIFDYSQAVSLNNELDHAYYNRGLIYIFLNNRDKGCEDISKAGELGLQQSYFVISKYCR